MRKHFFLLTIALLVFSVCTFAQQGAITGTVKADDGTPLPGATVLVKGTSTGVITDIDGNYSISVTGVTDATLVFSYVGYLNEEVVVGSQTQINTTLVTDMLQVDEVVVVGYGTQKKSLVSGAISKVNSDQLNQTQNTRVEQALQGKTAGVVISQQSGSPGAGMTVNIRGAGSNASSQPLYIVDGMRTGGIDFLSPTDIESVEILKDAASAAIYGAEAANGVILISTKKGKAGHAELNYDFYYGVQKVGNYMPAMNAQEYLQYNHEAYAWRNIYGAPGAHDYTDPAANVVPADPLADPVALNAAMKAFPYTIGEDGTIYKLEWDAVPLRTPENATTSTAMGKGTDWMSELFSPAPIVSHTLSGSGGSELGSFYLSGGYYNQKGVINTEKSNYDRYNFLFNGNLNVNKYVTVLANVAYTHKSRKAINENDLYSSDVTAARNIDPLTPVTVNSLSELPTFAQGFEPYLVKNDDGKYYGVSELVTAGEYANPLAQIQTRNGARIEDKILGGVGIEFKPFEGLTIKSTLDMDLAYANNQRTNSPHYFSNENHREIDTLDAINPLTGLPIDGKIDSLKNTPSITSENFRWNTIQSETYITYTKTIGDHSFTALLGNTVRKYEHNKFGMTIPNLYSTDERWAILSATDYRSALPSEVNLYVPDGGDSYQTNRLLSYFGRLNYSYKDKYITTINFRADGSSKFGPNNKFGYFPSISGAWVASRENFWPVNDYVSFAKMRASWGKNGNLSNLGDWRYQLLYTRNPNGGSITPTGEDNYDLKWEESNQTDIALDLGFFNNKINLTVDYFRKQTTGLLLQAGLPGYVIVEGDQPWVNSGNVLNSGLELELSLQKQTGDFHYNINMNGSFLKNKVLELSPTFVPPAGANIGFVEGDINRFAEGEPVWYFYGYKTDGTFQNWDQIYDYCVRDADGNPVLTATGARTLIQPTAVPGDIKLLDVGSLNTAGDVVSVPDGSITEEDKVNLGSPHPKFTYGININLDYKGFDFNAFIQGVAGNKIFSTERLEQGHINKAEWLYDERWTGENSTNSGIIPLHPDYTSNIKKVSDFWIQDGSYMRLKQVMLGYTLPTDLVSRVGIQKLRIYVSANNLLTFTKYKGSDPELGGNGGSNTVGIDYNSYPSSKSFIGGINVTF